MKTYDELVKFTSFEDRFNYIKLDGTVGIQTFGSERYLNQLLYHTKEWKTFRNKIILRDNGCDLGCPDREIYGRIIIHHINPISIEDILNRSSRVFDENNVICVSHMTHEAIHYGDENILVSSNLVERKPNDTCPWKE